MGGKKKQKNAGGVEGQDVEKDQIGEDIQAKDQNQMEQIKEQNNGGADITDIKQKEEILIEDTQPIEPVKEQIQVQPPKKQEIVEEPVKKESQVSQGTYNQLLRQGKNMEEEKQQVNKTAIKRKDSKFELQKGEGKQGDKKILYRPEFQYDKEKKGQEKLWDLMSSYQGSDNHSIQRSIVNHVEYTLGLTRFNFDNRGAYNATTLSVRDRLFEAWNDTNEHFTTHDVKRVYYMSLEFLLGRLLQNALVNIDLEPNYKSALNEVGYQLEDLYEQEVDPALGNGGLGRLAACFLDSLATLEIPAWGYGIRYDYGIFKQKIVDGYQIEIPDYWLENGNPWELERADVTYPIRFYGSSNKYKDGGVERAHWQGGDVVIAMAYDIPIPGFNTFNTNNLRLWKSKPCNEFDFKSFNAGDYFSAIAEKQKAEYITSVLYPNDTTEGGKELRLKQQYFFSSATIRDIIRRYKKTHQDWSQFSEKNQIQLNDTHPAIVTVEFLRILIDEEKLPWDEAWKIVSRTFAYTNHTVLPEALEKWSVGLIGKLLPRHLELIYLINFFFLEKIKKLYPGDMNRLSRMSLIEEGEDKKVRMAFLSIICAHSVNGVAALHTELLKKTIFKDFHEMFSDKIQNKTNGVTPRRWLHCCNKGLSDLISDTLGDIDEWITNMNVLRDLAFQSENQQFIAKFIDNKRQCKIKLQEWVKVNTGIYIPIDACYDVMVKRIHEYKRQLMNVLYIILRYLDIKATPAHERQHKFVPRVCMIGGKAAPAYTNAKSIIKLIGNVSQKINNDPDIGDLLKLVFLPNYCVSAAQIIIPAAELSQHISTAGTEASGTSNMKFVMNGSLIIGTMDGANVEICEEIGKDNMFVFGANVDEVETFRKQMQNGKRDYVGGRLKKVFDAIRNGTFGDLSCMGGILYNLENGNDHYCLCFDFYPYIAAQERVDATYKDQNKWNKMAIEGVAYSGKFSSDRTIAEYCRDIWKIEPVSIPKPSTNANARVRSSANLVQDLGLEQNTKQGGKKTTQEGEEQEWDDN